MSPKKHAHYVFIQIPEALHFFLIHKANTSKTTISLFRSHKVTKVWSHCKYEWGKRLNWIISFKNAKTELIQQTYIKFLLYSKPRQHIKKQRHYFVNKGPSREGYGSSNGHVWMWELDYKESWAPKNWCIWTVVLEKILESPLDCKEIQSVHPKGD